jgi:hypothetical protein
MGPDFCFAARRPVVRTIRRAARQTCNVDSGSATGCGLGGLRSQAFSGSSGRSSTNRTNDERLGPIRHARQVLADESESTAKCCGEAVNCGERIGGHAKYRTSRRNPEGGRFVVPSQIFRDGDMRRETSTGYRRRTRVVPLSMGVGAHMEWRRRLPFRRYLDGESPAAASGLRFRLGWRRQNRFRRARIAGFSIKRLTPWAPACRSGRSGDTCDSAAGRLTAMAAPADNETPYWRLDARSSTPPRSPRRSR